MIDKGGHQGKALIWTGKLPSGEHHRWICILVTILMAFKRKDWRDVRWVNVKEAKKDSFAKI